MTDSVPLSLAYIEQAQRVVADLDAMIDRLGDSRFSVELTELRAELKADIADIALFVGLDPRLFATVGNA